MMKHPRFRVRDVLALTPATLAEIVAVIQAAVATLATQPTDIEVCGSYALGCARLFSDIDFNLVMPDEQGEASARGQLANAPAFWRTLDQFRRANGLRIDAGALNWRSRLNSTVYSIGAAQMFGRDALNTPISSTQRWDPVTKMFVRSPLRAIRLAQWDRDPWSAEVPAWRAVYGRAFIETRTRVVNGVTVVEEAGT